MSKTIDYCRSCMSSNQIGAVNLQDIYISSTNERINFATMFRETTSINPEEDFYSKKLCSSCVNSLRISFEFRRQCWNTQEVLSQRLNTYEAPPRIKIEVVEIEPKIEVTEVLINENPPDLDVKEEENKSSDDDEFDSFFTPGIGFKTKKYKKTQNQNDPQTGSRYTGYRCFAYGCNQVFDASYELTRHLDAMQG